ncbi:MAG: cadmium-translocating P-type ATPase [Citrobacter freundii]|nr:MAG: cadmium-translocating P-type ATPase [Citrobacter freundii]
MEKIQWKVDGMDCSSCALTIRKYLEKEGMKEVRVNFATGDVSFNLNDKLKVPELSKGIKDLGYKVAGNGNGHDHAGHGHDHDHGEEGHGFLSTHLQRFWFCLPFTAVLWLHMIPGLHLHWLMNPWVQLALSAPVFIAGMLFFGKSAWKSLRNGFPNMNVLVAIGAAASFIYSLYGTLTGQAQDYMFYETTATIVTLVFLGNYLEDASLESTQRALKKLAVNQKVMANMLTYDDQHQEHIFPIESDQLHSGDLILIRTGEQVPADCKILWGEADVNEAVITGESVPLHKTSKDHLIGGSIIENGSVKAQVTAAGKDTVLAGIINLVKEAQGEKPPVQQLADKISAIFVPVVLGLAALTLIVNWIMLGEFTPSLMRAIAVLVIACPCAMGLATPAAIAVGVGRGARNGILYRNATSLELFKNIRQVVFDKTGTLTTGKFVISNWKSLDDSVGEDEFKRIVYSIEKYSNHPIAKSVSSEWKMKNEIRWQNIEEIKGLGMQATDREGNTYKAASYKAASSLTNDDAHNIYVIRNDKLIGWIDVKDELRKEAKTIVSYLHGKGIKTILLSGDRKAKADELAKELGIEEVIAEQTPEQKLKIIADKSATVPTAMVGDGINDAPALAKATVGISMSDASQMAMQTAQVVLMNNGLKKLPMALGLGKHTYTTIKQNLFWAFAYNVVAIPIAALGLLKPGFAALVMGLSDVVLAINSGRLYIKKVE